MPCLFQRGPADLPSVSIFPDGLHVPDYMFSSGFPCQIFSKIRNFLIFSAHTLVFSKNMRTFAIHFTKKDEAGEIKFDFGEMAEWSNAAVLKTVDLNGSGGSNPSLSAKKWLTGICEPLFLFNIPKNIPFFEFRSQEDGSGGKPCVLRIDFL